MKNLKVRDLYQVTGYSGENCEVFETHLVVARSAQEALQLAVKELGLQIVHSLQLKEVVHVVA